MSLAPELAAFVGRPVRPTGARSVRGYAGSVCEQPNQHTAHEREEKPMPTGVYERKKRASSAEGKPEVNAAEKPSKAGRKPRTIKVPASAKFGVFDDGTIELRLPTCAGLIGTEDAREFIGFLRKIGIQA